jgi:hypothetical protein
MSGTNPTGMTEGMDDEAAFRAGVGAADTDGQDPDYAQEVADVARWTQDIHAARKFDEQARREYGLNRKVLRGDRGLHTVTVPIAPSYVDVMQSFLFARNPSLNCGASAMTEPPPQKQIFGMVMQQYQAQRDQQFQQLQQASQQAQTATASLDPNAVGRLAQLGRSIMQKAGVGKPGAPMAMGGPTPDGQPQPPPPVIEDDPEIIKAVNQLLAPYQQKRDDAKQFAQTMEIVITHMWEKAMLKERCKLQVKSALSIGVGWIKAFWQERMGEDPVTVQAIKDLKEQLASFGATQRKLDSGESTNIDADRARLMQEMAGLQAKVEVVVARGYVVDFVAGEDMQVSTEVPTLAMYRDAQWLAHRSFITKHQAESDYPDLGDKLNSATYYYARKPVNTSGTDTAAVARAMDNDSQVTGKEADYYTQGVDKAGEAGGSKPMLCRWEIWDMDTNNVLTIIEGVKCYAKKPYVPEHGTTRGHPFFLYGIGFIDGSRHPRSMISRSEQLFNEYDSVRTNYREARRRAIPKTAYATNRIDKDEVDKLARATTGEMVGIDMLDPNGDISKALVPIAYNQIDMALYDTSAIRAELEMVWGIQEALSSSIHTAKTATESEIQQQGTQSRTGYMQDDLDAMFNDLACYSAETFLQVLDENDVRDIAGPFSLWEPSLSIQDMGAMLTVQIDAGSSGKPKTAIQQQAWATLLPIIQANIEKIGQLRGSSPEEVADCLEELIQETIRRAGDRVDASQFLPDPPRTPQPKPTPPPPPMPESALMGPQTAELIEVMAQVRAGVMSGMTAEAIIAAAYPNVPPDIVKAMIEGAKTAPGAVLPGTRNSPEPVPPTPEAGNSPAPTATA